MAITQINIYFENDILVNSQGNNFTLGYISDDLINGGLYSLDNNNPDLTITILEPLSAKLVNNNNTILMPAINTSSTLRIQLNYLGFTQQYSFVVIPSIPKVTTQDIYSRIVNLLPKNVYSQDLNKNCAVDNKASAEVISQLYLSNNYVTEGFYSLNQTVLDMFPDSGADGWEYFLTGNNRLLRQSDTQYGLLMQHIYSCNINNNNNPYWLAFNISKYIYLWLKKQRFVFISENIFTLSGSFILGLNSLGNCMLNSGNQYYDGTATIYVLTDNPDGTIAITSTEQNQINIFIRQLVRAGININIDYTKSSNDFGFTYLENTYFQDPRQNNTYCIAYNQNVLSEALGYTGQPNELQISSYSLIVTDRLGNQTTLTPSNYNNQIVNNLILANSPYTITSIITEPSVISLDVAKFMQYYANTPVTDWNKFYPFSTLLSIRFNGVNEIITLNNTGNVLLNTYLAVVNNTYLINIS